jgi:WS/DGAT/MGAT family acyltransferase
VIVSIERLTPDDLVMLDASETWPQDIGALVILDGSGLTDATGAFRIAAVRRVIEGRLGAVPRFRQIIHVPGRGLGPPLWADVTRLAIDDHVHLLPLPAGSSEAELLDVVEGLRRRPMERSRPMWEMWFLSGLPDGRVAWFVKLHHAMADGLAAMTTIRALLDPLSGPETVTPTWRARPVPPALVLLADAFRRHLTSVGAVARLLFRPQTTAREIRRALPALRELIGERPASRTSLGALIGTDRNLALIRLPAGLARRIGRAHDATANDLLLALTEAGLRALLQHRRERVDGTTVRVYVPVTLRRRLSGTQNGNRIAQMVVPLRLDDVAPARRLRRVAAETARRKARARTALGLLFHGRMVRGLLLRAVIRQRVHVTTASIPGGHRSRTLAGAELLEAFPILPLIGNVPLGVGAIAHAGTIGIGLTADRATYPDLDILVAGMRAELEALAAEVQAADPQAVSAEQRETARRSG